MVCDWIGAMVDNLVGCMETDEDDDGEEGDVVPRDAADGVYDDITDDGKDGLTVPIWICKLLGFVDGEKLPGELVCGREVG